MPSEHARCGRTSACLLVAGLLAGCAASAPVAEREYLDEVTAATVTVGTPVLVFARERPELAVHARDYLTLVPVDVNRAGTHVQYFVGYAWSTIDKRIVQDGAASQARFELVADGRRIPLVPHPGPLRDLGLGEAPLPAPSRSAALLVAPATREQQQYVADAAELRAVLVHAGASERFELWSR
jgi:hypothetical protein